MMKSFFKKLAFVMALAMVVSMAAPAGSALAAGLSVAYQAGGAVSELNVKAGAEQDLKFLGAPKNWKELGWSWTSSNEAVATVDAAGVVTAVADGTATITITVGDLSGSVTVNVGDAKAYDVTLGTADNKAMTAAELKKSATLDLNFYGVKDWNKANYTVAWSVSGDAANVDKNGVVTAVKAGKAVVTASIVNNVTGVAHNVTPVEVTVAADFNPDAFTVAQKDTDKFVLTFAEAKTADAVSEGLAVSVKIGDKDYPISYENVTVDGKDVTVTTYAQFENDEVYTLTYGKEVVTHTIVLGDVASVGVDYYTGKNRDNKVAFVAEEEENDYVKLVPVLYDQYGNDITAKYDLTTFDFTYEVSDNVDPILAGDNNVYAFGAAGLATVNVTAEWFPEDADDVKTVTGKTTFVVEKRSKIGFTLVKAGIANVGGQADDDKYAVLKDTDSKFESFRKDPKSPMWDMWGGYFATTNLTFDSNESWAGYVYTAVFKDNRGNLITSNNDAYLHGNFSYESTNNNVLSVADGTGTITVYKPGKANILVYFEPADGTSSKKLVASTAITVAPEPYPVSFKILDPRQTTASDVVDEARDGGLNDVAFRVQFLDQNGNPYVGNSSVIEDLIVIEPNGSDKDITCEKSIAFGNAWADKWYWVTFDGSAYDLGTNTYKKYDFKVSLREHDAVSTVKTKSAVLSLTVRNTSEEVGKLATFLSTTEGGTKKGDVAPNYKFNIAFAQKNASKDVAVKNIQGYNNTWSAELKKTGDVNAESAVVVTYQSTGNLNIAYVPEELLVNVEENVATNHAGYVYYKISAPSKTTIAGKPNVDNTAWDVAVSDGKIKFWFNQPIEEKVTEWLEDAKGNKFYTKKNGIGADQTCKWPNETEEWLAGMDDCLIVDTKATSGWGMQPVLDGTTGAVVHTIEAGKTYKLNDKDKTVVTYKTKVDPATLQYAGKGSYNISFSTTGKEGGNLSKIKTSAFTVTNSQSELKYLGLNPDYTGVTENFDFVKDGVLNADTLKALISEQLLFSFDDLLLGEYYESVNDWDVAAKNGWNFCEGDIVVNPEACKYTCSDDSIIITKLAFDVLVDDGDNNTDYIYTSVVNVGVRIKEK